jgi:hypothetical protein
MVRIALEPFDLCVLKYVTRRFFRRHFCFYERGAGPVHTDSLLWFSPPENCDGPQVFCIFLFFCAASLFGTIISQANEIVASQAAVSKELDSTLEAYLTVHPR